MLPTKTAHFGALPGTWLQLNYAGLQLAALGLRGRTDPARVIAAFGGSHRLVADYLLSEALEGEPPHLRRFLRETAVLERLCAPLCAALRGAEGMGARRRRSSCWSWRSGAGSSSHPWTTHDAGIAITPSSRS